MVIAIRGSIWVFMAILYLINIASAQVDERIIDGNNTGIMASNIQEAQNHNNSIDGIIQVDQGYNISVVLDHIFISKINNSIEISEIVVFRNGDEEIYYSKENHTFLAISTPPDIKNLKTQAMECCLVQDEGVVYMDPMQPIAPGANFEMQISYTLIPQDQEYVFNKSAIYNTTSITMFIDKKTGMDIEGSSEVMTLSGNEYKVITFNNLMAGENVSIPVKLTKGSSNLYAWIGSFFLLLICLIYFFKDKIPWRRKKESTLEELEIEKRNIFKTIHGFEKYAGHESSEEYRKLMEEYRQKAIRIFIKIDNLKLKANLNFFKRG